MKTPIAYYGGKQNMLRHILSMIPPHTLYAEPFCGGAAVFWAKEPSRVEVLNDTNHLVVNFWDTLHRYPDELSLEIQCTPHSRAKHDEARDVLRNSVEYGPIKLAWAFWVQTNMSFASVIYGGFAYSISKNHAILMANKRERLHGHNLSGYKDRLKGVTLECQDALQVIRSRDSKDSFFYIDPPYVGTLMGHYKGYTQEDFDRLLETLTSIEGKFLLSTFANDALNNYTRRMGWHTREIVQHARAAKVLAKNKQKRKHKTEVLTWNYELNEGTLFAPAGVDAGNSLQTSS